MSLPVACMSPACAQIAPPEPGLRRSAYQDAAHKPCSSPAGPLRDISNAGAAACRTPGAHARTPAARAGSKPAWAAADPGAGALHSARQRTERGGGFACEGSSGESDTRPETLRSARPGFEEGGLACEGSDSGSDVQPEVLRSAAHRPEQDSLVGGRSSDESGSPTPHRPPRRGTRSRGPGSAVPHAPAGSPCVRTRRGARASSQAMNKPEAEPTPKPRKGRRGAAAAPGRSSDLEGQQADAGGLFRAPAAAPSAAKPRGGTRRVKFADAPGTPANGENSAPPAGGAEANTPPQTRGAVAIAIVEAGSVTAGAGALEYATADSPGLKQAAPQSAPRTVPRRGRLAALAGGTPAMTPRATAQPRAPLTERRLPRDRDRDIAPRDAPLTAPRRAPAKALPLGPTPGARAPFVLHRAPPSAVKRLSARFGTLALGENPAGSGARGQGAAGSDNSARGEALERQPVLLVLDAELQALPWESLPGLRGQQCAPGPHRAAVWLRARESRHVLGVQASWIAFDSSKGARMHRVPAAWTAEAHFQGTAGQQFLRLLAVA